MALKRQQAAEDAIALGIRAMATGESRQFLPPGPIIGLSIAMQQQSQEHSNAERRIRGKLHIKQPQEGFQNLLLHYSLYLLQ